MLFTYVQIQKVSSVGINSDNIFFSYFLLVDEGKEDQNTTKSGLSSLRHLSAILMAFRWRADDCPTLNAGLLALWFFRRSKPVLLRNPIYLWFFRGVGRDTLSPSGSEHGSFIVPLCMCDNNNYQSPLILTELSQHNLINVSYLTACYLYQVMMTLHF